jgi:hypothetical protein
MPPLSCFPHPVSLSPPLGWALTLSTELSGDLDPLFVGSVLLAVNLVVLALALAMSTSKHWTLLAQENLQNERRALKIEW